jgi:hypothetical protein
MGILWNFQIASYYLFLNVHKPEKLEMFLNLTIQMQDVQILPFSVPNPFDQDYEIEGTELFMEYSIDLFFLRSNIEDLVSLVVFSLFYYILFRLFRNFEANNFMTIFLKTRIVDQVYVNISMIFYSIVTVIAFTASASLSNTFLDDRTETLNYFSSLFGLMAAFAFSILHPVILFLHKD